MSTAVVVLAPLTGTVHALQDVPDEVFAQAILGPGVAIQPAPEDVVEVVAPVTGSLVKVHPHAVALGLPGAGAAAGVLVHLGIDTLLLKGAGFTVHVSDDDYVAAGDTLITWDVTHAAAAGYAVISPVVVLAALPEQVTTLVQPGEFVVAGRPLLQWTPGGLREGR